MTDKDIQYDQDNPPLTAEELASAEWFRSADGTELTANLIKHTGKPAQP